MSDVRSGAARENVRTREGLSATFTCLECTAILCVAPPECPGRPQWEHVRFETMLPPPRAELRQPWGSFIVLIFVFSSAAAAATAYFSAKGFAAATTSAAAVRLCLHRWPGHGGIQSHGFPRVGDQDLVERTICDISSECVS